MLVCWKEVIFAVADKWDDSSSRASSLLTWTGVGPCSWLPAFSRRLALSRRLTIRLQIGCWDNSPTDWTLLLETSYLLTPVYAIDRCNHTQKFIIIINYGCQICFLNLTQFMYIFSHVITKLCPATNYIFLKHILCFVISGANVPFCALSFSQLRRYNWWHL